MLAPYFFLGPTLPPHFFHSRIATENIPLKEFLLHSLLGRQFGATAPPNGCGVPLKWCPSDKNAPHFGAYRSKNKGKKYSVETKQCFTLRWPSVFTWRTL